MRDGVARSRLRIRSRCRPATAIVAGALAIPRPADHRSRHRHASTSLRSSTTPDSCRGRRPCRRRRRARRRGSAEADDGEVVAGHALAPALPAVHPLAAVGVLVLFPDRLGRLEEVFFLGEEVVVGVKHAAAEALGGEVEKIAEAGTRGRASRLNLPWPPWLERSRSARHLPARLLAAPAPTSPSPRLATLRRGTASPCGGGG